MNLIRTHIVMIHGAGTAAVGMQHGAAGVGVSGIDLAVIDIIRGDVLFRIRGDLACCRSGIGITVAV
jgi:hypothetical protein